MGVFDEDVRERRALVSSARRRIGGSRSRRCSLPSDGLSAAQRGRLNGPVRTYALGRPMSWEQFSEMPPDLQRQYLARLRERFGLGPRAVARRVFRIESSITFFAAFVRFVASHRRVLRSRYAKGLHICIVLSMLVQAAIKTAAVLC